MSDAKRGLGLSDGTNARPLDDTIAQTGSGIPDDAASEGYDPEADAEMEHEVARHPPTVEDVFPSA